MATRTGTVSAYEIVRGPDTQSASGKKLRLAILYIWNNTASTVAGGTDTLQVDVSTATLGLAGLHNGATLTIRSVGMAQAALVSTTEYGATVTFSSNTVSLSPVAVSDWSSNATLPANTSVTYRPYGVAVLFEET